LKSQRNVSADKAAFSLLEVLVSTAVLALFVVLLTTITNSSFQLWRNTQSSIVSFDAARTAYDTLSRRLSQATLNTYLDYYDSGWNRRNPGNSTFTPSRYGRASDLHFVVDDAAALMGGNQQGKGIFFFAPLGFSNGNATLSDLPNLLNACGYYVEFDSDSNLRPAFLSSLPNRHRYRLIENILPTQDFNVSCGGYPAFTDTILTNDKLWITNGMKSSSSVKNVLCENIIALIIRPEVAEQDVNLMNVPVGSFPSTYSLTYNGSYDSRIGEKRPPLTASNRSALQFAQLPPLLRVVMVAVDEKSAARLTTGSTPPTAFQLKSSWFQTPANLNQDLDELEKQLIEAKVDYRIFNQVIPLRGAKFSAQKEN
jgi:uncharacterized protein (TIGR02599 family)